ncbi:hypothetical protein Tdes44962_MAKER08262 [Teratosphaeria destructans]|uniref:Uncharacterized protein n=1 Tax=Teratosphaeria destructans TaxID=418781 RepID=A0A9W7W4R3_9PEZI|nr:hypothetical protein Tdes44962_MAKER08262 [Teratosphaeria destructans]
MDGGGIGREWSEGVLGAAGNKRGGGDAAGAEALWKVSWWVWVFASRCEGEGGWFAYLAGECWWDVGGVAGLLLVSVLGSHDGLLWMSGKRTNSVSM